MMLRAGGLKKAHSHGTGMQAQIETWVVEAGAQVVDQPLWVLVWESADTSMADVEMSTAMTV